VNTSAPGPGAAVGMSTEPLLSVVIPVHNGAETIGQQLDAVLSSSEPVFEVVVVDNCSTDDTSEVVTSRSSVDARVRLIVAADKKGEAFARNVGVRAARAALVAFCDAEDVVSSGWVEAMWRGLGEHEYVTGPVDVDRLNPTWLAGMRGRALFSGIPRTVGGIEFAHGCNFGVRRDVAIGLGFDESVRIGADIDFAIRAHRAGVVLGWAPGAVVSYRFRSSACERWRQAVSYGRAADHLHRLVGSDWRLRHRCRAQVRRLGWLIRSVPRLIRRDVRAQWWWTLALTVGEVRGGER